MHSGSIAYSIQYCTLDTTYFPMLAAKTLGEIQ